VTLTECWGRVVEVIGVAVNLISPASFVDCTMICGRHQGNTPDFAVFSTVTLGFTPLCPPRFWQQTATTV
jgi:hypothetical protein